MEGFLFEAAERNIETALTRYIAITQKKNNLIPTTLAFQQLFVLLIHLSLSLSLLFFSPQYLVEFFFKEVCSLC